MKKAFMILPMVLFMNCWQVLFVSNLNELPYLGIDSTEVKRIETVHLPEGGNCYRVYYKEKGDR